MTEFGYGIKIPKERVAVLIGKDGSVKKEIEDLTKSRLEIDSAEGEVFISGEDAVLLMTVQEIVKAIARGFNPEIAKQLLKQDYTIEIINIGDYSKGRKNHLERLKGRIIGTKGKARHLIEETTDTAISVYGKTVSIIGNVTHVSLARRAIESILEGSQHASVYRWLEKKHREMKLNEVIGSTSPNFSKKK